MEVELILWYVGVIGITIESLIQRVKTFALIKSDKQIRNREIIFLICGLAVLATFYPHNLFSLLPFEPMIPAFGTLWSIFILTRTANGVHDGFREIGKLSAAISNRVSFSSFGENRNNNSFDEDKISFDKGEGKG